MHPNSKSNFYGRHVLWHSANFLQVYFDWKSFTQKRVPGPIPKTQYKVVTATA